MSWWCGSTTHRKERSLPPSPMHCAPTSSPWRRWQAPRGWWFVARLEHAYELFLHERRALALCGRDKMVVVGGEKGADSPWPPAEEGSRVRNAVYVRCDQGATRKTNVLEAEVRALGRRGLVELSATGRPQKLRPVAFCHVMTRPRPTSSRRKSALGMFGASVASGRQSPPS